MASSNTIVTPTIIARMAAMNLKNYMGLSGRSNRQFKNEFVKVGTSVNAKLPNKFRSKSGATISKVNIGERVKAVTITNREHVAWAFTSLEETTDPIRYNNDFIKPATIALANKIDIVGYQQYKNIYNSVGTPGTTPASFANVSLAARRLDDESAPDDMRYGSYNPAAHWAIANSLTTLNNPGMVEKTVKEGVIPDVAGFDLMKAQNVLTHTTGLHTTGSTPLMAGATAEGATSLATDGWAVSTAILLEGDVIQVAGCNSVNAVSGVDTGVLRDFVVTADVTSDVAGLATIPIAPKIYSAAAGADVLAYQTVTALPLNNAVITIKGVESTAYPQNLLYHKNALALVTVPLHLPSSAGFKARVSDSGFSIRVVKDYDITNDEEVIRLDVQFGWTDLYPELAVRHWG